MNLIEPPEIIDPTRKGSVSGLSAVPVPGGPVYEISPELWAWLTGKGPFPVPNPGPTPPPPTPPPPPPTTSVPLIDAFNVERAKRHLAPLRPDPKLMDMAVYWAIWMQHHHLMTHLGFAQRMHAVHPNVAAGEIVAQGQADVPSVMNAWMNSPGHRANILGDFTIAGVGVSPADGGTLFWCGDFCK